MKASLRNALVLAGIAASTAALGGPGTFEELTVVTSKGRLDYRVETMRNDADRARGMMFRTEMPEGTGMLFELPGERVATFWMKDTPLPLDMVFIRKDGTVDSVGRDAVPNSTRVVASDGPVAGVLEIPGGSAARAGIVPGDRVVHAFFGSGREP